MKNSKKILPILMILVLAYSHGDEITEEHVAFNRPEAWAMNYYTAVSLMHGNAPSPELAKGTFAIGFDLANIPHLSKEERTVGFNGSKEENMNKAPVLARPLLHYGVTNRLSLTAAYVPPIEIFDRLETHTASLFFNYRVYVHKRLSVRLRGGAQWTEARGDFTCAEEIAGIEDIEINPFNCIEPSHDRFISKSASLHLIAGYSLPTKLPMELLAEVAHTYTDQEFRVDALWGGGFRDLREIYTDGHIWSYSSSLRARLTDSLSATLSIIHVPLSIRRPPNYEVENDSLTHFRISLNMQL